MGIHDVVVRTMMAHPEAVMCVSMPSANLIGRHCLIEKDFDRSSRAFWNLYLPLLVESLYIN